MLKRKEKSKKHNIMFMKYVECIHTAYARTCNISFLVGARNAILLMNGPNAFKELSEVLHINENYEVLAQKARYFKQDKEGVAAMCKLMEDMRNEAAQNKLKEKAILMLKNGKISMDEIPVFFSELSNEEIEEIKNKVMQLV